MAVTLQSPDLIDPLHHYSEELSLLSRTFEGFRSSENIKQDDLQSVLEALAAKSSSNLSEQAKSVLSSSSELQNSEFPQGMEFPYKDRDIPPRVIVRPQERRPALGRKRARFSLRPNTSQSSLGEGMSLKIDQLQDPEEFFLAYDKFERAEKELRKQRGEISRDSTQHTSSTMARSRRPGILGRKAGYKQRFSSVVAGLDETLGPSQNLLEVDVPSPSNSTYEHGASQEKELTDSVPEEKNEVDGLLDELLSEDCTHLDGDGAVELLQERLQIKPINLEKLCLPKMDSVRKSEAKASLEELPRPIKPLSNIHNVIKRVTSKGSEEKQQLAVRSTYSADSPTPPRSLFSSTSMLSRQLSEGDRPGNPYLLPGIDNTSPARDSIHVEGIEKGSPSLHVVSNFEPAEINGNELSFSDKFVSMITEKDPADNSMVLDKAVEDMLQLDCNVVSDKLVTDDSAYSLDPMKDKVKDTVQPEMVDQENPVESNMVIDMLVTDDSSHSLDPVEDNLHKFNDHMDHSSNGCANDLEDKFEDMQQMETADSKQVELGRESLIVENLPSSGSQLDNSGPPIDEDHAGVEHSENTAVLPEQHNQVHQESPREPLNVQSKRKGPLHNGRKSLAGESSNVQSKQKARYARVRREVSRRKSLAGAGSQWQGGVRRSTRIKMRPLEYWRGERFLYWRVHESLLTVIGCKYASPVKGEENPKLKVHSFVSDDYKDLVGKASVC